MCIVVNYYQFHNQDFLCINCEIKDCSLQIGISEDDRFTPVSVIHNSSMYLQGPSRPLGAVIVGASGARAFCPNDVASAVMSIGGMPILLSLIAMSKNLEELYASLKALTCIVQGSRLARKEMVRIKGYQVCYCYVNEFFHSRAFKLFASKHSIFAIVR